MLTAMHVVPENRIPCPRRNWVALSSPTPTCSIQSTDLPKLTAHNARRPNAEIDLTTHALSGIRERFRSFWALPLGVIHLRSYRFRDFFPFGLVPVVFVTPSSYVVGYETGSDSC